MSASIVRGVGLILLLLGAVMFLSVVANWGISEIVFNILRFLHLAAALAFVGLFEMVQSHRKGTITIAGRQMGLGARILLTLTLLLGIYLLLSHFISGFGGYGRLTWVHAILGLISYGLTEMVLSRRRLAAG